MPHQTHSLLRMVVGAAFGLAVALHTTGPAWVIAMALKLPPSASGLSFYGLIAAWAVLGLAAPSWRLAIGRCALAAGLAIGAAQLVGPVLMETLGQGEAASGGADTYYIMSVGYADLAIATTLVLVGIALLLNRRATRPRG